MSYFLFLFKGIKKNNTRYKKRYLYKSEIERLLIVLKKSAKQWVRRPSARLPFGVGYNVCLDHPTTYKRVPYMV